MVDLRDLKRRIVHGAQRRIVNPVGRQLPVTMLETVGRKSGQPRHTAVGGRVIGNQFWMVSEHGNRSHYVLNIKANPAVRLRINGNWRTGTAHLLPDDDPVARLKELPRLNSAAVRAMGSDLLTLRIDLD
ncbi:MULTISPECIES: nitroreductase family deazaflavin-dependent oxidoreductase [unclassified Mycolicibacterium]|uniref:nitroreductase family deazaflavin-dependent oxidoreductase n=1 Tax=unclassified Mycolicibacterium TaxID=2636767 RepID=UPI0012DE603E|nr:MULTISPECIES: nitroreductase family deazaflavin-dependent oxidoreductase [unclassified Mycolicibacterium]MUL85491.1 nitroreductase family deazaflavin-dependent oxidoreductase [Mycolicibacterium sp. CBMA 329]MUL88745.1 nitroreductase family deazaflavin-dependent oxidoreductase [Mycolicibacterium sp. CBMA 331]MUM01961.1 nitroreductase family deazaflavin-dependent oxidoreductase [Mycolicibacterium sp. CBMA 334]MUM29231.1 nitroreductase family deazaflavin-dependent oxidoreductase [Mycolicibacter